MKSIMKALMVATVYAAADAQLGDEFDAATGEHIDDHYTYVNNGGNWPTKSSKSLGGAVNYCGSKGKNQSPIDLKNSWKTKSAMMDRF